MMPPKNLWSFNLKILPGMQRYSLDPGPSSKVAQNHYRSLGSVSHIDKTNNYFFPKMN
jgi:hypothetical protein